MQEHDNDDVVLVRARWLQSKDDGVRQNKQMGLCLSKCGNGTNSVVGALDDIEKRMRVRA